MKFLDDSTDALSSSPNTVQSLKPETIQDLISNGYIVENLEKFNNTHPVLSDWSERVNRSIACDYKDVGHHSPVFNKKLLDGYIWVELPDVSKNFVFTSIEQIQPSQAAVSDVSSIIQDNIWLKVPIDLLDINTGKKLYKICLKHKCIDDVMSLYFGYNIQDDSPDRPYVYM